MPTDKTFTVLVDSYKRTTWACGGIVSSGSLYMTGNVKLKFVQCGTFPVRTVWIDINGNGIPDYDPNPLLSEVLKAPNFGEPTQEKVVYYRDYTNTFWAKLCHGFAPAPCTWWWFDPTAGIYKSASVWIMIKTTFATFRTTRFPLWHSSCAIATKSLQQVFSGCPNPEFGQLFY